MLAAGRLRTHAYPHAPAALGIVDARQVAGVVDEVARQVVAPVRAGDRPVPDGLSGSDDDLPRARATCASSPLARGPATASLRAMIARTAIASAR